MRNPSTPVRVVARIAHDLGLAAWFGGSAMGAVGMNAATREVDDHTQRLRVANAGWFRWAPVVALSATAHLAGAAVLSATDPRRGGDRRLAQARSVATLVAVAATAATGISGRQVIDAGDVPVATAVVPIAETPSDVARAQRRLRWEQWLVPASTATIAALHAVQCELGRGAPLVAGWR